MNVNLFSIVVNKLMWVVRMSVLIMIVKRLFIGMNLVIILRVIFIVI